MAVNEPLRSFGRIKGRPLKPRQADLMESLLPSLRLADAAYVPDGRPIWLELGFGGGEHLAAQAARRPDVAYLGAEPFLNGVASALRHVDEAGVGNVRLWPDDGRRLMSLLPDASVERIFVLFPDPWPKARHHKRRLVGGRFMAEATRILVPGGTLRLATDWEDYANQILLAGLAEPRLTWTAAAAKDWRDPPSDHVTTRYETKRLGDCAPVWLEFRRVLGH
jgi:tRNA (guanine-N7-)-methyltransferase